MSVSAPAYYQAMLAMMKSTKRFVSGGFRGGKGGANAPPFGG